MHMNSKIIPLVKRRCKKLLKNKDILDIIIFGSAVKGKSAPSDIDLAVIAVKDVDIDLEGMHVSVLKPSDFFIAIPTLVHTLLREGYSLKYNKPFAQNFKFVSKVLYKYDLASLNASEKVRIVNVLRGKADNHGMVENYSGEWLANQVFFVPVKNEHIFEKFLMNSKAKFKKIYILMH